MILEEGFKQVWKDGISELWRVRSYIPTGKISLRITETFDGSMRTRWSDKENDPIENQTEEIVMGLIRASFMIREKRLRSESQWLEWEHRLSLDEEKRKERSILDNEWSRINEMAQSWKGAKALDHFLDAFELEINRLTLSEEEMEKYHTWVAWGRRRSLLSNPLTGKLPLLEDESYKVLGADV